MTDWNGKMNDSGSQQSLDRYDNTPTMDFQILKFAAHFCTPSEISSRLAL